MKEVIKTAIRKVTLELIYQAVDERTEEIVTKVDEIKKKQEDDFRYLIQRIDANTDSLRSEVKGEIGQLRTEVKDDIKRLDGKIDQLNQRIDTIIQMLMTIKQG